MKTPKTVVIDNYDSFTYNLVHYLEEINGERPSVFRNDEFEIDQLESFDVIVLSPGPGLPQEANLLMEVISRYADHKIILGVCLGHQALAIHFGGELRNLDKVYHGVSSRIKVVQPDEMHAGFDNLTVGRYHSWVVDEKNVPVTLRITSVDEKGCIMSFRHQSLPIFGIQYHPESVLTPKGKTILRNFIGFCTSNSHSFTV